MTPYYQDDLVTLYHGDCREISVPEAVIITDPPYPNNAGHFTDDVDSAARFLSSVTCRQVLTFWTELDRPPVPLPLVAVHIWHRSNVNGRPYEPIFHFLIDGFKKRSDVLSHAAVFDGVGPGCSEYMGHPTQKPVALMRRLIGKTEGVIFDPFCGSGSTLRAAKDVARHSIGIEKSERYCEIAANRLRQGSLVAMFQEAIK